MQGTVIAGTNNIFDVEGEDGVLRSCSIKGKKIKTDKRYYNPIAPGDTVSFETDEINSSKGQITEISERKNVFVRWNAKGRLPQIIASNLDYLILVTTPAEPPFRPRFIDRELIQAEHQGIQPLIVVNKFDLEPEDKDVFSERLEVWEKLGYQIMRVSAMTGEGMQELAAMLEDKRSAFVGQSGVGKSSLINVLDNSCILRTGSLSKKYGRGQHTTTKGTLLHINLNESLTGGRIGAKAEIIDTPGIRRFMLNEIPVEDIQLYFKEFQPLVGKCQFGLSCSHQSEKGCRILEAVENGTISKDRYESWLRITEELRTGNWKD